MAYLYFKDPAIGLGCLLKAFDRASAFRDVREIRNAVAIDFRIIADGKRASDITFMRIKNRSQI